MKEYKSVIIAVVCGLSAIICVSIFIFGLSSYKKSPGSGSITATGSASMDFTSDLIVWRGSFTAEGPTTQAAYSQIKQNSEVVKKYLQDNGVSEDEMIFYSVSIQQKYQYIYDENGYIVDEVPDGYNLYQNVSVTSSDVDKIEVISRDITTLIESGVEFFSEEPEYYYTKLDELKLEMIAKATENAKARIDLVTANSGSRTGKLLDASLGVFQITARNSDSEEYSYGGTFNTSSKEKTASVTVRLNYAVD